MLEGVKASITESREWQWGAKAADAMYNVVGSGAAIAGGVVGAGVGGIYPPASDAWEAATAYACEKLIEDYEPPPVDEKKKPLAERVTQGVESGAKDCAEGAKYWVGGAAFVTGAVAGAAAAVVVDTAQGLYSAGQWAWSWWSAPSE